MSRIAFLGFFEYQLHLYLNMEQTTRPCSSAGVQMGGAHVSSHLGARDGVTSGVKQAESATGPERIYDASRARCQSSPRGNFVTSV